MTQSTYNEIKWKERGVKLGGIKKSSMKISEKREVFCGTLQDAEIIDSEYNLFVLGTEKFETITYLRECFYGKNATTGRIQRIHKSP
jgi:hypothetical protein